MSSLDGNLASHAVSCSLDIAPKSPTPAPPAPAPPATSGAAGASTETGTVSEVDGPVPVAVTGTLPGTLPDDGTGVEIGGSRSRSYKRKKTKLTGGSRSKKHNKKLSRSSNRKNTKLTGGKTRNRNRKLSRRKNRRRKTMRRTN